MTLKRKVAISTLAASMAVTAFAGIPLSSKGLAEKVGIQANIVSAAEFVNPAFVERVTKLHDSLKLGTTAEVDAVRDLRDELKALSEDEDAVNNIVEPIWSVLQFYFTEDEVKPALFSLISTGFGSYYDPDLSALEELRNDPAVREGLRLIANRAGVDTPTVNEIVSFINLVENAVKEEIKSPADLGVLYLNGTAREELIAKALTKVRALENNKISQILAYYDNNEGTIDNITVEKIMESYSRFAGALTSFEEASEALAVAYIRSEVQASTPSSNNGLTRTISLSVFGFEIPNSLLEWEVLAGGSAGISVNSSGVVTGTTSGTATVKATLVGTDKVVFQQPITLSYTAPQNPWTPGGGFPGVPSTPGTETPVDVGGTVDAAVKDLEEILAGLDSASPSEKAELIAKAIDAATVAIDKIASYNAAKSVTVADGVATLNVPEADVQAIIKGIKDILAKLEALAPGSTDQLSPRAVIIQLGAVAEDKVSVNIPQALFTAARDAGLAGFEIVADRLSVTLPASSDFTAGAVNLSIERSNPADEPALEGVRTASSVYSFDVTVGGNAVTTFVSPVTLKVPVTNTDGLDEELLSLAKIANGSLEFHGGFLRKGFIVEPRTSFSSYVIVENKVSFNDIGSVSAWAGRQIQVMAAKGAIQGRAAGQFVPRDNVTRAEFAKMLISAMNLESNVAKHNFTDVKAGDWFAPFVAAAADLGIINGRTATSFAPNAQITRAEMATMLARTLKITHGLESVADVDGTLASFTDAGSIHATLKDGVALAASKELIIGYKGNFLPNDNATRAEAAVMVYRAFNYTE